MTRLAAGCVTERDAGAWASVQAHHAYRGAQKGAQPFESWAADRTCVGTGHRPSPRPRLEARAGQCVSTGLPVPLRIV